MSGQILYTPILKGKANDLKALGKMPSSLAHRTMPLVERIAPNDGQDFDNSWIRFGGQLRKHCLGQIVTLDLHSIAPNQLTRGGDPALESLCAYLKGLGVPFQPVFGFDHEPELWNRIARIAGREGRGITFRLKTDDLQIGDDTVAEMVDRLTSAGIPPPSTDLVIDLGSIGDLDVGDIVKLRGLAQDFIEESMTTADFRFISVVASSMPRDVTLVPKEGTGVLRRNELPLWADTFVSFPRVSIGFGDYGVVHPSFSDKNPATNANGKIRYTTQRDHLIFRGHSLREGKKYGQYRDLARRLVNSAAFLGPDYSFGDYYTWLCANGDAGTGNLGTWVEVDMNHHLVFASAQVDRIVANLAKGVSAQDALMIEA